MVGRLKTSHVENHKGITNNLLIRYQISEGGIK